MKRFLYDTNVFVYALGSEHPYRAPCQQIVQLAAEGALHGEASTDLVQEFLHYHLRMVRSREQAVAKARDVASLCKLHPLRVEDMSTGFELYARYSRLDARDAFFAGVAINRGIEAILSADRDFDGIPGLTRVDPLDRDGVAVLGG